MTESQQPLQISNQEFIRKSPVSVSHSLKHTLYLPIIYIKNLRNLKKKKSPVCVCELKAAIEHCFELYKFWKDPWGFTKQLNILFILKQSDRYWETTKFSLSNALTSTSVTTQRGLSFISCQYLAFSFWLCLNDAEVE